MLAAAFQKAKEGRLCTICNQRVAHDTFQRHRDICSISSEDDDVVFVPINDISTNESDVKKPKIKLSSYEFDCTHSTLNTQEEDHYKRGIVKVIKKEKKEPKRKSLETTPKISEYFVSDSDCKIYLF